MDEKVTELLDLTKKLLDQASEIVKSPLPHTSADLREILYQILLRVQLMNAATPSRHISRLLSQSKVKHTRMR